MREEAERVPVESREDWRRWLEANHGRQEGVWVVTCKKHCQGRHVPSEVIVEEALCFGWIDSLPRKLDADRTMLWLAPRKAGSNWSRINRDLVERLEREGRMTAAGRAKVDAARADGTWNALEQVDALEIPEDLGAALEQAGPRAKAYWAGFPPSVRRGILEWIGTAKRAETRARRVEETARLAAANLRANQWRERGRSPG